MFLPGLAEGAADQVADGLRAAARAHQSLVYPVSLTSTAIWLARIEPWHARVLDAMVGHLEKLGAAATVSTPLAGLEGFRSALAQVADADRVREAWGPDPGGHAVVTYADAGLKILLLQDHELARSFVEAELGALAAETSEAARLRDTLEASFRFGSHVAAAEHLQLHEHTVRNRLHKAEELLGHPFQTPHRAPGRGPTGPPAGGRPGVGRGPEGPPG